MEEYPRNSNNQVPPKEKHIERVVTGDVVRRKQPLHKNILATFGGVNLQTALGHVVENTVIPALRDLIYDGGQETLGYLIFGEGRGRRTSNRSSPSAPPRTIIHTPYEKFHDAPKRQMSRAAAANHNFDEILIESRHEAERVIESLADLIGQYNEATVAEFYEIVGVSSDFTDRKYGWTNIQGARATRTRDGFYVIDLPKPHILD